MKMNPTGSAVMYALVVFVIASVAQPPATAAVVEQIGGHNTCKGGTHKQPNGPFAVFLFCDDALGTNIAVYYSDLGDPRFQKWTLTHRFWQSDTWGADVQAIGWVPSHNSLVVTTSEVYGTGSVYLLNLEKQVAVKLAQPNDCGSAIEAITEQSVTVGVNDCEHATPVKSLVLPFPPFALTGGTPSN